MRFGFFLGDPKPDAAESFGQLYRDHREQAELVDEAGFDVVWFPEHHFFHGFCNPAPLLSVVDIAPRVRRVRLGTSIITSPYYHPLLLAEQIAMADQFVDGRLEIGFGRGASKYEYQRLGMTEVEATDRQRECLEVLLGLWHADEDFAYEGRYYRFDSVYPVPRPLQQPHPPMWMAARTPESMRFALEHGIGLHTTALRQPSARLWAQLGILDAVVAETGAPRRPPLAVQREVFISKDRAEIMKAMEYLRLHHVRSTFYSRNVDGLRRGYPDSPALPEGLDVTAEDLAERSVVGDVETCIERLREYETMGADEFIVVTDFGQPQRQILRSLEQFATHVMPHFRSKAGDSAWVALPRVDAAAADSGDGRRASLMTWYEQRIGFAWREWDVAKWLDHFDRLGGPKEEPSCYAFDFTLAPQGVRADAAGMIDGTGRLMLVSDRSCPTCRRP